MSFTAPNPADFASGRTSRLLHLYGCHIETGRCPGVGDRALCGYVRSGPPNAGVPFERGPNTCVVCLSLRDEAQA